ncbi:MAG TPA: phosphoenolpyruvate--protein phosphotransferase [Candidatus Goldiibacteriota bacterium]|nr:phosphoenolpyruvate--protein phosphotransferase [Candidatus Goldiibacteriota bacterium]
MMYKGQPASPGIIIGKAFVISKALKKPQREKIKTANIEKEILRLKQAIEKTKQDILHIKERIISNVGNKDAEIFNAYILFLKDNSFVEKIIKIIREENASSEDALHKVLEEYIKLFDNISDGYLKEKIIDIKGLFEKIINNLSEKPVEFFPKKGKWIIIAHDLSPADTAELDKKNVLGFITETGGATSHTAIVARSLEIPAVVGLKNIMQQVKKGDLVIIDGEKGIVMVNPEPDVLETYKKERIKYLIKIKMLKKLKKLEAITLDKHKVILNSNIEFPEEALVAKENNADGIGLVRTEYIYINRTNLPTEEEQFDVYKKIAEEMSPKPVTIRTLDIGGDKFLPYFKISPEQNPFLGLRAIRLSLSNINIFRIQIRAILRASAFGNVKIMFPMISTVEEFIEARNIVNEEMEELKKKKINFDEKIKVGVMIEVPSAVIMSEELAKRADFLSIGTNDLIQYTLAVDRGNAAVLQYYNPLNPAVLRLIKKTVESAHKNLKQVSVCGEMAGEPHLAFLLLGLGVDELSVSPSSILQVKRLIRNVYFKDAFETAETVLKMEKADEIKEVIFSKMKKYLINKQ